MRAPLIALAVCSAGTPPPASAQDSAPPSAPAIHCDAFALGLDGAWTARRRTAVRDGAGFRDVAAGERFDGSGSAPDAVDVDAVLRSRCGGLF